MELALETKGQTDTTADYGGALVTPEISPEYWLFRVKLSDKQAIVGFPKFGTIGIGFAVEKDWNKNLPFTFAAEEIYNHIEVNKGDPAISREDCLAAIELVKDAAYKELVEG